MYRARHISGFFLVFIPVTCLLLLPTMSPAVGFGDSFPDAIADKTKSIPIKDISQSTGKRQDPAKPAPSQNNNNPALAVVETKEGIPAKTSMSPLAAADFAVAKEAEEVRVWCQKNLRVKTNHDCECVADRFIVERQADPVSGKDALLSRIMTVNQCPNLEGIRANGYKECIVGSGTPGFNTNGNEVETYCHCVGKRVAKNISEHKGKLGPRQRGALSRTAITYCRRAEAYR